MTEREPTPEQSSAEEQPEFDVEELLERAVTHDFYEPAPDAHLEADYDDRVSGEDNY